MSKCNPTLERLEELAGRYRSVRRYEVNDLILFDYVYADNKLFNEKCGKEARGIVFHKNGELVSRPFHKFFNYGEALAPKEFSPWLIGDKIDGSLLQLTVNPVDGSIFVASRSSHNPEKSYVISAYNRLPKDVKKSLELAARRYPDYTHLYEIVDPHNQIVIFYDTLSVRYLTSRHKKTGTYALLDNVNINPVKWDLIEDTGLDELVERAKTVEGIEGWVVYDSTNAEFIKIKTLWYFERHKITSLSIPEHYLTAWTEDKLDDYISYAELLEGSKGDVIKKVKAALDLELSRFINDPIVGRALDLSSTAETRKDVALRLNELLKDYEEYKKIIPSAIFRNLENRDEDKIAEMVKLYKNVVKKSENLKRKLLGVIVEILNARREA